MAIHYVEVHICDFCGRRMIEQYGGGWVCEDTSCTFWENRT